MRMLLFLIAAAAVGFFVFSGCTKSDQQETQQQVQQGASKAGEQIKNFASSAGKAISKTADQVAETAKVKGPIDASKDIDSSQLSVETVGKTIYISGSVPTQAEKDKVDQMAYANKDKDYIIEEHVKVAPKPADTKAQPKADDSAK